MLRTPGNVPQAASYSWKESLEVHPQCYKNTHATKDPIYTPAEPELWVFRGVVQKLLSAETFHWSMALSVNQGGVCSLPQWSISLEASLVWSGVGGVFVTVVFNQTGVSKPHATVQVFFL